MAPSPDPRRRQPNEAIGMRILVAGATGAVGRPLVAQLVADGHSIVGPTRSAPKAASLRTLGAEAMVADALDAAALRDAVLAAAIRLAPRSSPPPGARRPRGGPAMPGCA